MVTLSDILAISGLGLGIFSCVLTGFLLGAFICLIKDIEGAETALADKVKEFGKMTAQASEANNSMGTMLTEMGDKVQIIDERITMLSGTNTGGKSWQNPATRTGM
tara:strand:+ start:289 stop:606 length:318 start_codon:yes stop_codon:yes gene_type:complete